MDSEDTRIWEVIDRKNVVLVIVIGTIKYHAQVIEQNPKVNYYMLRQVDYDGNEEEFKMSLISIRSYKGLNNHLNYVYFNPLGQLGGQQLKKQIK